MGNILFTFMVVFFCFQLPMAEANPMKKVAQVNAVPMLMPYLVQKAETLQLTPEQIKIFAKWRAENMSPALISATAINESDKKIKKAVMSGASDSEIMAMYMQVNEIRMALAKRTLNCHRLVQSTLTTEQWQQLSVMYLKRHKLD